MIHDIYITEHDGKKKYVGELDIENRLFSTYRHSKKHILKRHNAWAIDRKVVEEALVPNNVVIRIVDRSTKSQYLIESSVFHENASAISFPPHREQLFLHIGKFEKKRYP